MVELFAKDPVTDVFSEGIYSLSNTHLPFPSWNEGMLGTFLRAIS